MRAATTALSNVLTAHPEISGFGETHVSHNDPLGPGRMVVSILAKGAFRLKPPFIFDKILHSTLHTEPSDAFFEAHAIFLLRPPEPTIASIVRLARQTDMVRYRDQGAAAAYYLDRVEAMARAWDRFPQNRRIGILTDALWHDPDKTLADLAPHLPLSTPLRNRFQNDPANKAFGRGDPFADETVTQIERRVVDDAQTLGLTLDQHTKCTAAYETLKAKFAQHP